MHDPPWHGGAKHEACDPPSAMLLRDASRVGGKVETGTSWTGGKCETQPWRKGSMWNGRSTSIPVHGKEERAIPEVVVFADEYATNTMCSSRERRYVIHALGRMERP
mmetsp:Transcript_7417/g.45731  ORF Transcript_7417/g.45731 Transcript_7417/m.45731 type:complete len:107 (+) Transcript_7417:391-711(+)